MSAAASQLIFDWDIGHARPWLEVNDLARGIRATTDHALNLLPELDVVIDIKTKGASRPCYRIFRPSFDRYLWLKNNPGRAWPETNLEERIKEYLDPGRNVLAHFEVALHLHCHEKHILRLGSEIYLDLSSAGASRCFPRTTRTHLLQFINARRIS